MTVNANSSEISASASRLPSMPMLDRDSPLPLYEQIKRRVLTMVLSWPDQEERFYSDQELSEQFGVSRMTVRQAIQELVTEGYLRRARGLGTFVCAPKVDEQFTPAMDFLDQSASQGRPITLRILHCAKEPATRAVSRDLGLAEGGLVWHVVRLRTVQEIPISIDYRYIDATRIADLDLQAISSGSMLDIIGKQVELAYADLQVEAGGASEEHADFLSLNPGDPVLTRHLLYYDVNEHPVMTGVSYYRADQVRYSLRVPVRGTAAEGQISDSLEVRGHNMS